jgi:hypothetical protein
MAEWICAPKAKRLEAFPAHHWPPATLLGFTRPLELGGVLHPDQYDGGRRLELRTKGWQAQGMAWALRVLFVL